MTGVANKGRTVSILMRGSNKQLLEEADRSVHDALCVIRCLVKKRFFIFSFQFVVYMKSGHLLVSFLLCRCVIVLGD
jgi:chaperonin GroEL (HSP60 family)